MPVSLCGQLAYVFVRILKAPPDLHAVPLLDDMKRWFEGTLLTLSAKSDTTKAIQYSLNRWSALAYYCSDGQAEIDNLIAERALRGVAIAGGIFYLPAQTQAVNVQLRCIA
jgi:hypothetical protein